MKTEAEREARSTRTPRRAGHPGSWKRRGRCLPRSLRSAHSAGSRTGGQASGLQNGERRDFGRFQLSRFQLSRCVASDLLRTLQPTDRYTSDLPRPFGETAAASARGRHTLAGAPSQFGPSPWTTPRSSPPRGRGISCSPCRDRHAHAVLARAASPPSSRSPRGLPRPCSRGFPGSSSTASPGHGFQ